MLPHITGESHRSIVYSVEKAQRELGYKPVVNYREGYRRAADWCRAQRLL
jgi:nucleoside-diphosphate-sugar epimerase